MERLTFEGNFCDIAQCACMKCPYDTNCSQKQVWERLKAYEDTGLSPEKVSWMKEVVEAAFDNDTSRIERAHNLHVADKEERVIVLPCKRGDELWTYCNYPVKRVYSFTVSDVSTLNGRAVLNTLGLGTIRPEDIGKTVFLTREEAEKALAKMEGKKDASVV